MAGLGGKRLEYLVPDAILAMQSEPEILASTTKAAESESEELTAKAIWGRFHRASARKQRKAVEKAMALRIGRGLIEARLKVSANCPSAR